MGTTRRVAALLVTGIFLLVVSAGGPLEAAKPRPKTGKAAGKASPTANVKSVSVAEGIMACQFGHFWVVSDLPEEEAKELVVRLETMVQLISEYWIPDPRRRAVVLQKIAIPCVVLRKLEAWPAEVLGALDREGMMAARLGGGVTISQSLYLNRVAVDATSVVYASAAHGTPQHEAVHALCHLPFATTGPTWYSEGMAEMGKCWREGDRSVNADPRVIEFLRNESPRKTLNEVLAPFQATGDCWQNYAWRWVLCHLPDDNSGTMTVRLKYKPKGTTE